MGQSEDQSSPAVPPISVLAVDDHPLLLDGIEAALAGQPDMQLVATASDGQAGIDAYRHHHPDVTLMDLQMPGMSGLEALRAIRQVGHSNFWLRYWSGLARPSVTAN